MDVVQDNQVLEDQSHIESYGGLTNFVGVYDGHGGPDTARYVCDNLYRHFSAEFMEHGEKPLPIDIRLLGALAEKCRAFAKALHYKEMEFEGARSKKMDAS
ncbi:hypothetical protein MKX03_020353 [Papaver bracteatum]|nr:hypothetical protein MKX03_020353 [Papaver bracteatum]